MREKRMYHVYISCIHLLRYIYNFPTTMKKKTNLLFLATFLVTIVLLIAISMLCEWDTCFNHVFRTENKNQSFILEEKSTRKHDTRNKLYNNNVYVIEEHINIVIRAQSLILLITVHYKIMIYLTPLQEIFLLKSFFSKVSSINEDNCILFFRSLWKRTSCNRY